MTTSAQVAQISVRRATRRLERLWLRGNQLIAYLVARLIGADPTAAGHPLLAGHNARKAAADEYRGWLKAWPQLARTLAQAHPDTDGATLRTAYLRCASDSARYEARRAVRIQHGGTALGLLVGLVFFLLLTRVQGPFGAAVTFLTGAALFVFARLTILAVRGFKSPVSAINALLVLSGGTFLIGFVVAGDSLRPGSHWLPIQPTSLAVYLGVAVVVIGATWVVATVAAIALVGLASAEEQRQLSLVARERAIRSLTAVICATQAGLPRSWDGSRPDIIRQLKVAARDIEFGIPRTLDVLEQGHQDVFRARCRGAALHLRELCLWIALPRADTAAFLRAEVADYVVPLLLETYDDLPGSQRPQPTAERRIRRIGRWIRTGVVGAIPLGCLMGFKLAGIEVHSTPLGEGFTIFCIAWTAVTYMSLLDPLFSSRLTAVREFLATLRGSGTRP